MAGIDSAGLGEVCANVLASFKDHEVKGRLLKNIFLTGSPARIPNLAERLEESLRPFMPPDLPIEIQSASEPSLDSWKGMARFSRSAEFGATSVTRAEYEEFGGERVKRWWGGNWNGGFVE